MEWYVRQIIHIVNHSHVRMHDFELAKACDLSHLPQLNNDSKLSWLTIRLSDLPDNIQILITHTKQVHIIHKTC